MTTAKRIKVTWEMTEAKARECIMRMGGDPSCASTVQGLVRNSRYKVVVRSGAAFGVLGLQHEGYFIAGLEIVDAPDA